MKSGWGMETTEWRHQAERQTPCVSSAATSASRPAPASFQALVPVLLGPQGTDTGDPAPC